jgi:nucleoside-diphosphate-sugar epimerase
MKIFVTGAIGFVGRWLAAELEANGHQVVPAPGPDILDIADRDGLARWLDDPAGRPDAVIHLAGMASPPTPATIPRRRSASTWAAPWRCSRHCADSV